MQTKKCTKCKQRKPIDYFNKDKQKIDGLTSQCKTCKKITSKKYYIKNLARIKIYTKKYNKKNRKLVNKKSKEYYKHNKDKKRKYYEKNIEHIKEINKIRYLKNKEHFKEYRKKYTKERLKTDIDFKLKKNLQRRIHHAIKENRKSKLTIQLIGCDIKKLRSWIESQFTEGMSWDNYGEWHIDHVYPVSKFNLSQPYEQLMAFNWFNLQPMWAKDNLTKSNKLNI